MDFEETMWTGLIQLTTGSMVGLCESGNGHSDSINGTQFLDQLNDYELLKKNFSPWN